MRQTSTGVYPRLSAMMFIQFSVWGAGAVLIADDMGHLGFTGKQISYLFGTTAFGVLVSPLVAVWVADRVSLVIQPVEVLVAKIADG